MNNPKWNAEGYSDLTAYYGMKGVLREEAETDKQVSELIKVLKFVVKSCGFEITGRISLKDKKSGRIYK